MVVAVTPCILILAAMPGGSMQTHLQLFTATEALGCEVRIEGTCDSACTLALGLADVCVTPQATMRFHRPYGGSQSALDAWANLMAASYPAPVAGAFWGLQGRAWFEVGGADLIGMGMEMCE